MFLSIKLYRLSVILRRAKLHIFAVLIDYINRLLFSCWVPGTIKAGKSFVLGYGGLGVVIHSDCVLGDNVHIDQHVTVGGNGTVFGVPRIGHHVYIGAGAKVLGPIIIGSNVVIAANAVVIESVPDGCVVAGVPARIIKRDIKLTDFLYHLKN